MSGVFSRWAIPAASRGLGQQLRKLYFHLFSFRRDILARLNVLEDAFAALATPPPDHSAALNCQAVRQRVVESIFATAPIRCVIETGTYTGTSTAFFAKFGVPVHSCELSPALFYVAHQRLAVHENVHLYLADSRAMLRELARQVAGEFCFFYLDAHWYADLPLGDEIRIIQEHWHDFIAMIDDFEVPGDPGYGYDRYGRRRLNYDYIADLITPSGLDVRFPCVPSSEETGARRGYVFLSAGMGALALADNQLLTAYKATDGSSRGRRGLKHRRAIGTA
ncbi:MAG TPA: hypothetical protein VGB82_27370 [Alphaproteobacteria bacterium]